MFCSMVQQTHNSVKLCAHRFDNMIGLQSGNIGRNFGTAVISRSKLPCLTCKLVQALTLCSQCVTALQPGVASVYCSIVQQTHNGVELYERQFNEMIGMTFGEIRRRFDTAVIVGFMAKAGELNINPADDEKMPEGARL